MSIVEEAYEAIVRLLQTWKERNQEEKRELIKLGCSLMGKKFHEALLEIEKRIHTIEILDYSLFFVLNLNKESYLMFKTKIIPNCMCTNAWNNKVNESFSHFCLHQIIFILSTSVYSEHIAIRKVDPTPLELLRKVIECLQS